MLKMRFEFLCLLYPNILVFELSLSCFIMFYYIFDIFLFMIFYLPGFFAKYQSGGTNVVFDVLQALPTLVILVPPVKIPVPF